MSGNEPTLAPVITRCDGVFVWYILLDGVKPSYPFQMYIIESNDVEFMTEIFGSDSSWIPGIGYRYLIPRLSSFEMPDTSTHPILM